MKKASLLVFSLGVMAVVAAIVCGLGFRTFVEVKTTKNLINSHRALYLAVSGLELAKQIIKQDQADFDYVGQDEAWSRGGEEVVEFSNPYKKGKIYFTIEDEAARLNLNTIADNIGSVEKLFELSGVLNFEEKVNKLNYYIRGESSAAAVSEHDISKGYKLSLPEEITLIKTFTSEDYASVKNYITAFGDNINLNTAPRQVLSAFIDSTELVDKILERRCLPESDQSQQCYYSLSELKSLLGSKFKDIFDVKTNYFRVKSYGEVDGLEKKIVCVMDRAGKIVYWKE